MRDWLGEHVLIATVVLTLVSLALIFGAVLGLIPDAAIPVAPGWVFELIPHVNGAIAVFAPVVMGYGYLAIRRRQFLMHRRAMLVSLGAFTTFLVLYLYNLTLTGTHPFDGPDIVYDYVYLPILLVHMVLAMVCIPLLYYVALIALTRPISEIPRTNHARVARPALALWATVFALGFVVYLQLYVIY